MSARILGPAGCLPPGEWVRGAFVRHGGWSGLVLRRDSDGDLMAAGGGAIPADCRLDLTEGPLDFGTRALLALVAPGVEQPLTAPGWLREYDSIAGERWLLTVGLRCVWVLPTGGHAKTSPRKALSLALHAAWEAAP